MVPAKTPPLPQKYSSSSTRVNSFNFFAVTIEDGEEGSELQVLVDPFHWWTQQNEVYCGDSQSLLNNLYFVYLLRNIGLFKTGSIKLLYVYCLIEGRARN